VVVISLYDRDHSLQDRVQLPLIFYGSERMSNVNTAYSMLLDTMPPLRTCSHAGDRCTLFPVLWVLQSCTVQDPKHREEGAMTPVCVHTWHDIGWWQ
jgi:hypothetical protein